MRPRLTCPTLPFYLLDSTIQDLIKLGIDCVALMRLRSFFAALRLFQSSASHTKENTDGIRQPSELTSIPMVRRGSQENSRKELIPPISCMNEVACQLIRYCAIHQMLWSVENPGRSFMWDTKPVVELLQHIHISIPYFIIADMAVPDAN